LKFLMFEKWNFANAGTIIFSDITRRHLNFSSKQSVER